MPSLLLYAPKRAATLYLHDYQSVPLMAASLAVFVLLLHPGRFGAPSGASSARAPRETRVVQ